mmetsp:Transcript_15343/g.20600  ORF Transcript_15343/g.20600 Transcript_15343/m.20600 type:complete len:106 (-) Transcript_15343:1167-1484(-)
MAFLAFALASKVIHLEDLLFNARLHPPPHVHLVKPTPLYHRMKFSGLLPHVNEDPLMRMCMEFVYPFTFQEFPDQKSVRAPRDTAWMKKYNSGAFSIYPPTHTER